MIDHNLTSKNKLRYKKEINKEDSTVYTKGNYLIITVYRENKGPFYHDKEVVVNYEGFFELQVVQMSGCL